MSDSTDNVREGYDRWAAVYDHDGNPLTALEGPVVRELLGDDLGGRPVLDLGCGTGRHTAWLAAEGASVTALDFSPGMLVAAAAKVEGGGVTLVEHDVHEPLPFADGGFERIVSGLVLEHLRSLGPFFAEIRRVLSPRGVAVVSAMHPAMFARGSQAKFRDPESGEAIRPGSVAHQLDEIEAAIAAAPLEVLEFVEAAPDAAFAERYPRAAKHVGHPMLAVWKLA